MKKGVVIGATGIIGNHIVRALLELGHHVIAVSRGKTPALNLQGLAVERRTADILDQSSLIAAFKGANWVFQAAAYYPRTMFSRKKHVRTAMQGTKNLIAALKNSRVERLVYTSSLTTIGRVGRGLLADEGVAYNFIGRDPHPYFLVKYLCECELMRAVAVEALPIVVVNPTACFGDYELKPRDLCLIPKLVRREIPAYVVRDLNVVDVADVARGHVLAAEKGRVGERYVLGGHNLTVEMVIKEICDVAGVRPPRLVVPLPLGLGLSLASELLGFLMRREPHLPILGLRFVQHGQHFSLEKAKEELSYTVSAMAPCYERAIQWYKKIGYI